MGEREWNQRLRGESGLRWWFGVNAAVAARELAENTASGIGGGSTLRSSARQGSALAILHEQRTLVREPWCAPIAGAALDRRLRYG